MRPTTYGQISVGIRRMRSTCSTTLPSSRSLTAPWPWPPMITSSLRVCSAAAMIAGMRLAHAQLGLVLEPSGAVCLGALLTQGERWRGQLVATILCGGNLTPEQMGQWLGDM